jgi:hypothetical protein
MQVVNMEVDDIKLIVLAEDLLQHDDVVGEMINAGCAQAQRFWTHWHKFSTGD